MRPVTETRALPLSIGELSRLTGVHIETIRYYEAGQNASGSAAHHRRPAHLRRKTPANARIHPAGAGFRFRPRRYPRASGFGRIGARLMRRSAGDRQPSPRWRPSEARGPHQT